MGVCGRWGTEYFKGPEFVVTPLVKESDSVLQ